MERIRTVRFPIHDIRHTGTLHGDHNSGECTHDQDQTGLSELYPLTVPNQLLWGPLCFVVAYLTATRHSLRHPMQIVVCMSHLYGDTLYYATSLFDHYVHDRPYSRPEGYYFWVYYFLMNFIWIVVPFCKSTRLHKNEAGQWLTGNRLSS